MWKKRKKTSHVEHHSHRSFLRFRGVLFFLFSILQAQFTNWINLNDWVRVKARVKPKNRKYS